MSQYKTKAIKVVIKMNIERKRERGTQKKKMVEYNCE
jgi:hypothetical protein